MARKKKKAPLPEVSNNIMAVDTHCHLDMSAYKDDCDAVIERARRHRVGKIMTIGIDLVSSKKAIALAEKHDGVFASVGVHPHHVADTSEEDYKELVSLASHPKVVAYGEIGMDMVRNYAPRSVQKEHFAKQVSIGKELGLPIIVHDREAHEDVMQILKAEAPFDAGGVMHCFSGDLQLAKEVIDLGFHVSIPGVVTFNKADMLQEVAQKVPLDSLVIETDGPFLTPVPYRGKRNEPAYVLYTAAKIAELRGIPLDDLVAYTSKNAGRLFGI